MSTELSDRQLKILAILIDDEKTTYKKLSDQLNLSTKTIGKEVSFLKKIIEEETQLQILIQPKKGVSLIGDKFQLSQLFSNREVSKSDTPEDRVTYTFAKLLNANEPLKIQELADELYVSRSTMEKTIKDVKIRLKKYDIEIVSDRHGLKINADEKSRRRLMSEVVNYYWGGFTVSGDKTDFLELNINLLSEATNFLDKKVLRAVATLFNSFMNETDLVFTDYEFQTFVIHLTIAIERIRSNNFLDSNKKNEENLSDNTVALIQLLEEQFSIFIPKDEQSYIDIHITSIEKNPMNYRIEDSKLNYLDLGAPLKVMVTKELEQFDFDDELINNLVLHLNAAIKRLRLGVNIYNPYTDQIKLSFKQAFMISVNLLEKIEEQFNVSFNDDESAYITLHVQTFLERYQPNKIDVILVCSSGYGTSKLLEQRIQKNFSEEIKIKKVIGANELQEEPVGEALVISTIPIEYPKFPVIIVSPLMLEKDLSKIKQYLKSYKREENPFLSLLNADFYFMSEKENDSQEEVLKKITKQLIESGYANEGILESAEKREVLSSTALNDFSMPHAEITFVNTPVVSVYINPKGIDWNGTLVHLVFFFSLNQNVKTELNEIYETFNEIVSNNNLLTQLKRTSTFEDLISTLKEGI